MNIKRIVLSLGVLVVVGVVAFAGTRAFFSDTETSVGNTLAAGAIDLQVDNTSYYNGIYSTSTSWTVSDLTDQLFFDFHDLKPGDWGEDTISLHVNSNDAWACAAATLTGDDENDRLEPEIEDGDTSDDDGELDDEVSFAWWADDGDNVYEDDEGPLFGNTTFGEAFNGVGDIQTITLADANNNFWTGEDNDPLAGNTTAYIGKYWCFGEMTPDPVAQGNNSPTDDPGFDCDGADTTNISQTDSIELAVSFYAVQSRNNTDFLCADWTPNFDGGEEEEDGPVVEEGALDLTDDGGVRYRSFGNTGGQEIYVGISDLGVGANRDASEFTWSTDTTHDVEVAYSATTDTVETTVDGTVVDYTPVSLDACTTTAMNISVVARDNGSTVELNNVMLDGNSLGDFQAVATAWNSWNVTNFDFNSDFTLTGEVELDGVFGGQQELSKIEVLVGCTS